MLDKNEVYYSMGGLPQYFNSISEMFKYKITNDTKNIILNTSSQPNSIPHLGTLTTLMSVFAIAEELKRVYKLNVLVQFDEIECSPKEFIEVEGHKYVKSISDIFGESNISISDINMNYYYEILNFLKQESGINYQVRTYQEFQENKYIREGLIKVVNDQEFFIHLFNPSDNKLHIRTKCPKCLVMDKDMHKTNILEVSKKSFIVRSYCYEHGEYETLISKDSLNFIEMNTQLRDLLKGYLIAKDRKDTLTAMIDGGDWGGTWSMRIHAEGMNKLNMELPIRLFTPLILDRSGGKLSKSHYLNGKSYSYVNDYFNDYFKFKEHYCEKGLKKLYKEIKRWVNEPKKFFRNYSIDYIETIMEE